MPYTILQIDEAMRQIAGPQSVRSGDFGWSRPIAMLHAAACGWITRRPEDEHSAILREALQDMNSTGVLHPSDGVWPESEGSPGG